MVEGNAVPAGAHPPRRGRSAWAILAGFLCVVLLSLGTDELLHALKVYPPWEEMMSDKLFVLATAYRSVYNVVGCYVAAWLAPRRPMRHALLLGWVGVFIATLGAVATWSHQPLGPRWYSVILIVLALPCAWVGGKLYERRARPA